MKQITLMIKIKSKENSFLNSGFESLHKRFGQYHLNDSTCHLNYIELKRNLAID